MFVIFLLMASIMLINLVIAMMTRTYERISGTEREWLRQVCEILYMLYVSCSELLVLYITVGC